MLKIAFALIAAAASLGAQTNAIVTMGAGQKLTSPTANTPPEQRCIVEGQVTNSQTGEPLRKANIYLVRHRDTPGSTGMVMNQEGYSEVSAADGTFRMEGIEPGEYSLSGERSGYLRTRYGSVGGYGGGTRLTLEPGQHLTKVTLALVPQGVISGKVVDQDADPVGGMMVSALRQMWVQGNSEYMPMGSAMSDEEGNFRIPNLHPGKYYISAQRAQAGEMEMPPSSGKPDIRQVRTYFPDSMTRDGATAVLIKPGQTASGMDIHMQSVATHHIRGKIAAEISLSPSDFVPIQVAPEDDDFPMGVGMQNRASADHTFDVAGVAPGTYRVWVTQFSGRPRILAEANVDVGASDVNNLVLAALPSGTLRGQITLSNAPSGTPADLKSVRVVLTATDHRHLFEQGQSEAKENGTFIIENVVPAIYKVHVYGLPQGTYVRSVQFGSQDVWGKEVDLSQGVAGEFQVALRYGVAEISGTVAPDQNADEAAAGQRSDALVILIPEAGSGEQTHTGSPDQKAGFSIKELPPGKYRAVAVLNVNSMLLQNSDFTKILAASGMELELKENDKKQVQIPLTPAADVQRILANLGIDGE